MQITEFAQTSFVYRLHRALIIGENANEIGRLVDEGTKEGLLNEQAASEREAYIAQQAPFLSPDLIPFPENKFIFWTRQSLGI